MRLPRSHDPNLAMARISSRSVAELATAAVTAFTSASLTHLRKPHLVAAGRGHSARCRCGADACLSANQVRGRNEGGRWMPLQRCRTSIMFQHLTSRSLLRLTVGTPCVLGRAISVCPRAAHKSVTYRSLRSTLLAAQCRRQAK